jgi:CCR4-NOT transcription complex subunit 1
MLGCVRLALIAESGYNASAISAVVLHIGMYTIGEAQAESASPLSAPYSGAMDCFQQLCKDLDPEARYVFLNAIANQLRYPNSHTHYFSCVLLFLFESSSASEVVQEQITRVLLERLIVHRPHPWGLLITFIELIKNPRYAFWSHPFVRCATEIQQLFESVARSCIPGSVTDAAAADAATTAATAVKSE